MLEQNEITKKYLKKRHYLESEFKLLMHNARIEVFSWRT